VLPEYGDKNEDGRDEDYGKGDLGDRSRGEWFDFSLTAWGVFFFVPAWESRKQEKTYKGENDGDDAV